MSRQAVMDTAPERLLRQELRKLGFGYRLHRRPLPALRRSADIVFVGARVAVFVDGCFWHGCPDHKGMPQSNAAWWTEKIARNRERDSETDECLREAGWVSVRIWEHEDPIPAAARIGRIVKLRRSESTS
jgi:DNA mismatch endonuclease (patch repair protein)